MIQWVNRGIRTGIKTTVYPTRSETATGATPGLPLGEGCSSEEIQALVGCCPTGAIIGQDDRVSIDYRRCVHCYRCAGQLAKALSWSQDYEWAGANETGDPQRTFGKEFHGSIHILVVDAGDCGACLNEVKQLNNPYYNMHRLGFFLTPSPRHADILMVVGPVTDHMRVALQKTYEAMPYPKKVVAVGACALSGGVFGPSFVSEAGVAKILPVDVEVPGQPPPPLAILHGLLVAAGRKSPADFVSPATTSSIGEEPLTGLHRQ
jgi:Ni,Fe-hydrogenase III small subunit/ferredoxin-like protein FixX